MFNKNNNVERLPVQSHDQVNGLLDKGCSFEGKLTFDGSVQINGDFRGEIYSDGTLVIGPEARVRATIFVDSLVVSGRLEGKVEAKSRIDMRVPATVTADLKTGNLSIEDGVMFQGTCQMDRPAESNSETYVEPATDVAEPTGSEDDDNVLVM